MAVNGLGIDQDSFTCSICLDLLKDPVSIPCGHSYCMNCVDTHWNGEEDKKSYSCPQCRQTFTQRPVLVKNTLLAILMESLKKSRPATAAGHPSSPAGRPSSPAECPSASHVFCDFCSGTRVRAVKSCLQCLVSYCKEHLQPHFNVPALKKHKLVEPSDDIQENLCSRHDEVMKMFCRTDQQCICYLCSVDEHKGHDTVTAAAERAEKQKEIQALQQSVTHRLDLKQKDIDHLQLQINTSSRSADTALELCDRSLRELLTLLGERMSEARRQVRAQQITEDHRVKELQVKVQQEITELERTLTEVDTLSQMEDHVHFLHKFASLSKLSESSVSVNHSQSPPPFQDTVTATVSKLRSALQELSLGEPPAALHKQKVTPKTDASPAAAQAAVPPQQPLQSLLPRHVQTAVSSSPLQNSEETSPSNCAASVHRLKLNSSEDHPEAVKFTALPEGRSGHERVAYGRNTLGALFFFGYNSDPSPPLLQDTEEFPSLSHHKKRDGPPPKAQETPAVAAPQTSEEAPPAPPHRNVKPQTPDPRSEPRYVTPTSPHSEFDYFWEAKSHARRITWDRRSLNDKLELSHENYSVRRNAYSQKYMPHAFRFTALPQVVSKESLTGQCYFEVELKCEKIYPIMAVAYKDIRRDSSSDKWSFGMNAKSWALECHGCNCILYHNGRKEEITASGSFIGVFVDYNAGLISFFRDNCRNLKHIFTFKTTFTGPLVAGTRLNELGSTVKLIL